MYVHWNIDDQAVLSNSVLERLQQKGFIFSEIRTGSIDTINLRVNAIANKNGTQVYCSSGSTHSDTATLLIIAGIYFMIDNNNIIIIIIMCMVHVANFFLS